MLKLNSNSEEKNTGSSGGVGRILGSCIVDYKRKVSTCNDFRLVWATREERIRLEGGDSEKRKKVSQSRREEEINMDLYR